MARERIPVFERTRVVAEVDIDLLGHVNNGVWVEWVVDLADAHSSALGLSFDETRAHGGVWVVRHQDLHYVQSALPGDTLRELTWLSALRGARCQRHARFFRPDGALVFAANTKWAFIDPTSLRPRRVPAEIASRFDLLEPDAR